MTSNEQTLQFYQIFMEQSEDGIWMAEFDSPLSLNWPAEKQMKHFFHSAIIRRCNPAFGRMYDYESLSELIEIRF